MCAVKSVCVYITGGSIEEEMDASGNCYRYDIARDQWQEIAKMNQERFNHGSCQLGRHLYVFCGYDSLDDINTVEKLKIDADPNI